MNPKDIEDIVRMCEKMSELDFKKSPSLIFIEQLRDELVFRGYLTEEDATELVLCMTVSLGNENIFSDAEMKRMVNAFATMIGNAQEALVEKGFSADSVLKNASKFSFNLS